jgi:flagellar biosynthesis/type III secretory pathway chaperone
MIDLEQAAIVMAQKQELARLMDDRVLLMAQVIQYEQTIAKLTAELSQLKSAEEG